MSSVNHRSKLSLGVVGGLASSLLLFGCGPSSVTVPPAPVAANSPELSEPELGTDTEIASADAIAETEVEKSPEAAAETDLGTTKPSSKQPVPDLPTAGESVPNSAEELAVTEQLEIAGIEDAQAVKAFVAELRAAAIASNREAIVNLVHYPFTTYDTGTPLKTYESPTDLLADFEQVVTQPVLDAMSKAQYASLFTNYQGVMIGDGEVWFGQFDEGLKIQAINGK